MVNFHTGNFMCVFLEALPPRHSLASVHNLIYHKCVKLLKYNHCYFVVIFEQIFIIRVVILYVIYSNEFLYFISVAT